MKWKVFATDFDGTIATDGSVDDLTQDALERLRENGVEVILVTGRELKDFDANPALLSLFDLVVAENGGVLYNPATQETRLLTEPPNEAFVARLQELGVPLSVGQTIVATVEPHEVTVLEVIKEMALELQVIFNKGAVMILPSGVNKATGLRAALEALSLAAEETVAAGDAENDHVFLGSCGLSIAVANALPALKERVNYVASSNAGAGVAEAIERLLRGDFDGPKSV